MTLDECIAYLEDIVIKGKPRSRKAKQILKYLYELKTYRDDEWKKTIYPYPYNW